MGLIDDLTNAIKNDDGASKVSTDPKATTNTVNDDGGTQIRNSNVAINHDNGEHDTMFSKTTVSGQTGEAKYEEGGHGPKFEK
ncbi:hypothetical protein [Mucilaginibacter flavus]|uniref:hypothetical protein n=1 Tax=Mucilaginibacter flavus TaxID=931504 RepID=UPI0025B2EFAF|nr:hypothetical protein [Mucilaginibacter flavus]MDN3581892.1 hypothetical protein [Mucilaginibacter flavus]